ncbi:MGMT family protein [Streptomyces sp. bgisy022]|uniref:MGMT family protein n=1 Tax=Streptomyces sp. bgisy022 TaxID=3413769 RepID=UPI003D740F0F
MSQESLPSDAGPGTGGTGPETAGTGAETADAGPGVAGALPEYAERVLDVADLIPPGRVMTYGDVAEWLGEGGPRQVGRVMSRYGGAVPWWRVVRADGVLLPGHALRALGHYREEGTPLREAGRAAEDHLPRIDMRRARWDGSGRAEGHT